VEFENRAAHHLDRFGVRQHRPERVAQAANGARVELRDARFVDADLGADLLHRRLTVVVEANHLLFARRQRRNRGADPLLRFLPLVGFVGLLRLRRNQRRGQRGLVEVFVVGEGRGGFDRIDANDSASQTLLVGANLRGEVGQRRLVSQLAAQFLARRFQLATLTSNASRPGVLAQRVNHCAPNAPFCERFELDPARLVEAVGRVNQTDDAILNQIPNVNRMRHRSCDAAGQLLDEGDAGEDPRVVRTNLGAHECDLRRQVRQP